MKKSIILVLCVCCIGGAAFYLTHRPATPEIEREYYADYLPEDTLVTLSLLDLKGVSESFPESALGGFLAKPAMRGIMSELGATDEDIQKYDDLYDGLADVMTNPALRQVFGDDVVIALRSPDPIRLQQDPEQEFKNSMLAFGTSVAAGPVERIARIVMRKDVTNEHVSGLDMTRIRLDEHEILYGYSENGIIVLAYNPDSIVTAVKQKETGRTLRKSSRFTATQKFWAEADDGHVYAQSYVNMSRLRTVLAASEQRKLKGAAAYLDGFTSAGGLIVDHQGELHITTRAEYDAAALNESVKKQYQSLSDENYSLSLVNEKTLLHYWFSSFGADFIRGLLSAVNAAGVYTSADETVQQELGLSLEQILAATGSQAGIIVHEIVNAGMVPLPRAVLFFQVKDHEIVQQVLDKLRGKITEQGFAEEQSEEINGHTVYYWSVMPIEATHLAVALTDNMLYVANGESSLKNLLADQQEPTVLSKDMADVFGGRLARRITDADHSIFVMRPAQLAAQVKEAVAWLSDMLLAGRNVSTITLREETLKLMRSVDVVAVCGDIEEDHAVSTVVFKKVKIAEEERK